MRSRGAKDAHSYKQCVCVCLRMLRVINYVCVCLYIYEWQCLHVYLYPGIALCGGVREFVCVRMLFSVRLCVSNGVVNNSYGLAE